MMRVAATFPVLKPIGSAASGVKLDQPQPLM